MILVYKVFTHWAEC